MRGTIADCSALALGGVAKFRALDHMGDKITVIHIGVILQNEICAPTLRGIWVGGVRGVEDSAVGINLQEISFSIGVHTNIGACVPRAMQGDEDLARELTQLVGELLLTIAAWHPMDRFEVLPLEVEMFERFAVGENTFDRQKRDGMFWV